MDTFIGTILPWAGTYAPQGWLFCWGQELPILQYQAVFAVIGVQYGGNGTTTFKLPDLRGRFPIGAGFNPATNTNWQAGTKNDNNMSLTLGVDNIPTHSHGISNQVVGPTEGTTMSVSLDVAIPVNTDATNTAPVSVPANNNCTLTGARTPAPQNGIVNTYTTNQPTANATLKPFTVTKNINVPTPAITVNSTCQSVGISKPVSVQPPTLCLNFIICLEGIFPPHPY